MRISDWSSDVCSSDLVEQSVGQLFILPARCFAARHVADAADTVDDRVRMFGIALELQLFGMLGAGRLAADLGLVIDADRVGGVEVHDAAIIDQQDRKSVV